MRDMLWRDSDEDDYNDYYLWKKYRREKLRRQRIESLYDTSSGPLRYHRRYGGAYPEYYRAPSYSVYSYPNYGYRSPYPYYGGYGGYGGYGYGGGYGGSLFSIGAGRQLGISTPIGGFGISSGFGIGIG